ncbi:MAG TPA: O-antigen ligase family protein [Candidatus Limnocylindria bacterium]
MSTILDLRAARSAPAAPGRSAIHAAVMLVAALLAVAAGASIGLGNPALGAALAAVPAVIFILNYPFGTLLVWAAVLPFFLELTSDITAEASPQFWVLHRLMLPGMLVVVMIFGALGYRRVTFKLHWYDAAIAAFIAIGVVNILVFAVNPNRMLISFYDKVAVPLVLFWLVRAIGIRREDIGRLVALGVGVIGIQVAVATLSWAAPSVLPSGWIGRAGDRAAGTFGGPAPLSITVVLFGLLAVYWAATKRPGMGRVVLVLAATWALFGAFITMSRGSWVGAGAAFLGLVVIYPKAVIRVAIVGLVMGAVLAAGPLQDVFAFAASRVSDESTIDSRIVTNDAAVRIIETWPLTGVGFGNFERYDEEFKQSSNTVALKLGGSAHNTYLNMAAEMGLPATALYFVPPLVLLLLTLARRRELMRRTNLGWPLVAVLWLALLDQFLVSNFLEMLHAFSWGTSLWWLTLGLIATVLDLTPAETEERPARSGLAASRPSPARPSAARPSAA